MGPAVAHGDGPRFDTLLRDGRRATGVLTGSLANGFQFQSTASGIVSLDKIQSLEQPYAPRSLPDRSWKRLKLINGDVLHARQISTEHPDSTSNPKLTSLDWQGAFEEPVRLPLAALAEVAHPAGTRCVVYQDFEDDSAGWRSTPNSSLAASHEHARSGQNSLRCSADVPMRYELSEPLEQGWLEFSFFLPPELKEPGTCTASLQVTDGQAVHELQVSLIGKADWYEFKGPETGGWQRHVIARRPGWHTLAVAIQPGLVRLALDDFPLAAGQWPAPTLLKLSAVKFAITGSNSAVWIDDFAITQAVPDSPIESVDRKRDQVDLATGDQLFGQLVALRSSFMELQANARNTAVPWPDLSCLHLGVRPIETRAVTGRMLQVELQPWSNTSSELVPDSLSGALVAIGPQSCTLEHPLCGRLTIPWKQIRRLRPAYYGMQWVLEGRPYHVGDEVKLALRTRIPDGTGLTREFNLQDIPKGAAYISLTAVDLEPAGKGTLDHPWLKRLQAGELTTELSVNSRRIAVLNTEVTGRGTARQPQRLRIKVPMKALQPGKNRLEIRLTPSRGAPLEYDDWEMQDWHFEIETPPATK